MKIMMITAADSIHAVRWANAYAQRGHEVVFVALSNHHERGDKFDPAIRIVYLKHGGTKGYILNAISLRSIWKQEKPDVVNVHYASGYGLLARLAGIHPYTLSVWGSDVYGFPSQNWLNKQIVVRNINKADKVASTSYAMADQVRRLIHDPKREIIITPFGVDTNRFSPEGPKAFCEEGVFYFGIVKKQIYLYGIDMIIKAFARFKERWEQNGKNSPIPKLFICGKGENKPDFERLRDNLGLHDDIIIEGYIPNEKIPDVIRSLDVFCLGSVKESFGVSAIEAMSCGKPVIATATDGFKEVMTDKTGIIIPIGDEVRMADEMWNLYSRPDLCKYYGEEGRKRATAMYTWEQNVDIMESFLKSQIGTGWSKL